MYTSGAPDFTGRAGGYSITILERFDALGDSRCHGVRDDDAGTFRHRLRQGDDLHRALDAAGRRLARAAVVVIGPQGAHEPAPGLRQILRGERGPAELAQHARDFGLIADRGDGGSRTMDLGAGLRDSGF